MSKRPIAGIVVAAALSLAALTAPAANAAPAEHTQTIAEAHAAIDARLRASTPVTEQLHDSLPATATAITYAWSTVRYMDYLNQQGVWTGYSTGYRVLGEHDSTLNQRRISRAQFTGNACPDPNAYVDAMTFAQHRGGSTGSLIGAETFWYAPSPTSTAYCNWDYIFSSSQNGWYNNAYTATWTIHVATSDPIVSRSTGYGTPEASDAHVY